VYWIVAAYSPESLGRTSERVNCAADRSEAIFGHYSLFRMHRLNPLAGWFSE
jgi:hypothetical protein